MEIIVLIVLAGGIGGICCLFPLILVGLSLLAAGANRVNNETQRANIEEAIRRSRR